MQAFDYVIIVLILLGAVILFFSSWYTKEIFNTLKDNKLKSIWKKLRILMFVFIAGYLSVVVVVFLGKSELLSILSGAIFFMGALFVLLVVRAGLDSFKKINKLHQYLDDTELKYNELEQFAQITSHDLKTPLRGISSLAAFIKEDIKNGKKDDINHYIDTMQQEVEHFEKLINGILEYSKLGKINPVKVDLSKIVQNQITKFQDFDDVTFISRGELPSVMGDKELLSKLFENLIGNAVIHNEKVGREVIISSYENSKFYEITVEDNGSGIAPKYHNKIFDVFQKLDQKDPYRSIGLGLSIAKKIAEKHNGGLRVESNGSKGSKFIVSYPKRLY